MGKHAGGPPTARASYGRLLGWAVLLILTLVAWGFLVVEAVSFGRSARSGQPADWWFLGVATFGAAACLFVSSIVGGKLVGLLRSGGPAPSQGGRRITR